ILQAAKYSDEADGLALDDPDSYTVYAQDMMSYHSFGEWDTNPTKSYDWQDQAFRQGSYNQADLQISGGSENTRFYGSLQYLDQE
uniref:hypothetical protein n=1 Tax=Kingella denitrificans TaxID=502 RepID=UPI001C9A640F